MTRTYSTWPLRRERAANMLRPQRIGGPRATQRWEVRKGIIMMMLLAFIACNPAVAQQVIHVDQIHGSDNNTGLTWPGTRTIQKGIERAQQYSLHEIWVAKSAPAYKECVTIDRWAIQLYGGFLGSEVSRDQRDWVNNPTVIRGFRTDPPINDPKNCPAVSITLADGSIVDGFTITGGGGTNGGRYGGGLYIIDSDCWIWNNLIRDNAALHGGGIYVQDSAIWVKNNRFISNFGYTEGGGVYGVRSSFAPKMELNTFQNNIGTARGGAVLMEDNCDGWVRDNTFENNSAAYGGGLAFYQVSGPLVEVNEITGNGAPTRGGGIYCNVSNPNIRLNTISGNTIGSEGRGGGIAVHSCGPLIERNRISQNACADSDGGKGGGISQEAGTSVISGNIIDHNTVYHEGGGIDIDSNSNVVVTSDTIAWNTAYHLLSPSPDATCEGRGGGIHIDGQSTVTIRNTLFYNNWWEDICCDGASTVDRDYNCYRLTRQEECFPQVCNCDNCTCIIGTHEHLCDPDILDGDYHIGPDSCCIDAGTNDATGIPGSDYTDLEDRIRDGDGDGIATIDIGADELWMAVGSIVSAKSAEEGRPVRLPIVHVTLKLGDYFYVEDKDRISGIRCYKPGHTFGPGDVIPVYGKVRTNSDCERYIEVKTAGPAPAQKDYLKPLAMHTWSLGGGRFPTTGDYYQNGVWSWNKKKDEPPWAIAKGLNNIGLYVTIAGKVTYVHRVPGHPDQEFFYVDDGSLCVEGTVHGGGSTGETPGPNIGVRCVLENNIALLPTLQAGDVVTVSGACSCYKPNTDPVRLLRIMDPGGIVSP
jgi:hypothetical protein